MADPKPERLSGVKEMKVEAVTVGKHHNMGGASYMGHQPAVVFHNKILLLFESAVILSWKYG